jgi:GntR family transcriptional regulator
MQKNQKYSPTINFKDHTPRYVQIFQHLKQAIQEGKYAPNDRLPSENELSELYGISRITAIASIDELVKSGLVYRQQGRGTFVAQPVISDFSFHKSFTEVMRERGMRPSSRLVSLDIARPDNLMVQKLKMPEDEYYRLVRVRLANDSPLALQSAFLPTHRYPDFLHQKVEETHLFDVIRNNYQIIPAWSEAVVEAAGAESHEASLLEIKENTPVLVVWHLTLDDQLQAIEYVRSVYRADRFSFSTGRSPLLTE